MNVTIVDPHTRDYRCARGPFTELPVQIPAGPPPALFALPRWSGHPQVSVRGAGDQRFADVTHEGCIWTYRLSQAATARPSPSGGIGQQLESFDVAARVD
ncbi:hypothetical protein [uncultured Williamsia sp.]|uniref:hypothetical protein n=1 Tax=uncultured Williamsia sp. TaxID=259311 RepID=UPI00262BCDC3|nr:hypothetical protein [uncultured Williamsia sp.]